jgi:hypothetical protein
VIPIYEQGQGKGIGLGLNSFLNRFDTICQEHVRDKRAKAFAFIFYDFSNGDLRAILKDKGVFAQLDRLASTNLSIFYLHTGTRSAVTKFNAEFLSKLDIIDKASPPCVVFFKLKKDGLEDVAIAQLDNADLIHGFHELYRVIQLYVESDRDNVVGLRYLKWLKSSSSFIALEVFKAFLKTALDHVLHGGAS